MSDIWFISDHHFGQKSILGFKKDDGSPLRPGFDSVEEMNDHMLDVHNSIVKDGDVVWLGGDLYSTSGLPDFFKTKYSRKMKGRLKIVVGNHDKISDLVWAKRFSEITLFRKFNDFGLIYSHVPMDANSLYSHKKDLIFRNIHGHIHWRDSPTENHFNVCVERNEYRPFNIDELRII